MSNILNVGARALMASQAALQTTSHNIANVNTPGYSRQSALMATVPGQFTGGGYIGKGVELSTVARTYDAFLTRQAMVAGSIQDGDQARADKLGLLEAIFPGGSNGLGAAVSDMLDAFTDVASAPLDLAARTVALTRVDEAASRMRTASTSLDDLQLGIEQEMANKIAAINTLAQNIANVNDRIARTQGSNQPPNDLLDQRDQFIRELNRYIQTSNIPASDGSVGVFIGGSQALVLGTDVATLSLSRDDFQDPLTSKLAITRTGSTALLDENTLGGGEVSGLLRFQNQDLREGRNLLGRLTLSVTTVMNEQHKLGVDLNGNPGGNLFSAIDINTAGNVRQPVAPATPNAGTAGLTMSIANASAFVPSDYLVAYTGASSGTITRLSDGQAVAFATMPATIDGLTITQTGAAAAGDRFLLKPFATSANTIQAEFSAPRALAVASPVAGKMGTSNSGSLKQASLQALTNPPTNVPVTFTFTSANTYTRSDTGAAVYVYQSGSTIDGTVPATTPPSQWSVVLQGTPAAGDTYTVQAMPATMRSGDTGNAKAMMALRDRVLFDGAILTDGYSGLISQIGVRTQSAQYAAEVSTGVASSLETQRTSVAGVNLDEEAAKLLQYQQAYQASAKTIQVAQTVFDALIATVSR